MNCNTTHYRANSSSVPGDPTGTIPTKLTSWPKYEYYVAPERFQQIAKTLGLPAGTPEEGVESYALAVESLRAKVGIPASFQAQGVDEQDFIARLDELAMGSYRDQCAPANPRMPMLDDMKDLMVAAFYGISIEEARTRLADRPLAASVAS